jgi:hypothetical protein
MTNIHTLKFLPSTQVIQTISAFSEELEDDRFDFKETLISLKETVLKHGFMNNQDHSIWAVTRGVDYFDNPKLFAQAPLTYVCAFISEIFKRFEIEEIYKRLPKIVLKQALSRLAFFSR